MPQARDGFGPCQLDLCADHEHERGCHYGRGTNRTGEQHEPSPVNGSPFSELPHQLLEIGPLPGSAWVEIESPAVKVDGGREVLRIAEAARLALDAHDLAVEAFGDAIGDRVLHEAEHAEEIWRWRASATA